ncbi:MAG: hypothetical protein FWG90_03845 [Oscillospiraceae bacterium]|nr:hypothetical protein [Oscillospiraceae bacterium]
MAEKAQRNKALAKIFLVFSIMVAAISLAISIYLGGQMKTVNKLASALERDDYRIFADCVFEADLNGFDEAWFDSFRASLFSEHGISEDEKIRVKYKFTSRSFLRLDSYSLSLKETLFSSDFHNSRETAHVLRLSGGKWRVTPESLNYALEAVSDVSEKEAPEYDFEFEFEVEYIGGCCIQ